VRGGKATAVPGPDPAGNPTLTVRLPLADFVRAIAAGGDAFMPLLREGTMTLDGDLAVAARLGEMFGGRSAY
jgi:hypothetical protein